MKIRRITMASVALLLGIAAYQTAQAQQIALESKYLSTAVEGFRGYRIVGKLGGEAKLTMDPNTCALDQYGDRTICTKIARTVRDVKLAELEIKDPTGQGRRLFAVSGHDLKLDMKLVTMKSTKDGWFVFTARTGDRIVVDLDPATGKKGVASEGRSCTPLARTIDGTKAKYKVAPGIVNGTWILTLTGKKPNGGTTVEFRPVQYVKRPDYWEIEVVDCADGVVTPMVSEYQSHFEITQYLGHKGIEVVFSDEKIRIKVPPSKAK